MNSSVSIYQLVIELYRFMSHSLSGKLEVRPGVTDILIHTKAGNEWVARVFHGSLFEDDLEVLLQTYSTRDIERFAIFSTSSFSRHHQQVARENSKLDLISYESLVNFHTKAKTKFEQDQSIKQQSNIVIKKDQNIEPDEDRMKRCPFCAEPIQAAAIVCRYCGRSLSEDHAKIGDRPRAFGISSLEGRVQEYIASGYSIVSQTERLVTLEKEKKFNWVAFFIFFGVLYLLYFFVTPTKKATLRVMPDGKVEETGYTIASHRSAEAGDRRRYRSLIWITIILTSLCVLYVLITALLGFNMG